MLTNKKMGKDPAANMALTCFISLAALILVAALTPSLGWCDDPAARAIMEKVDARDDGDNQTSDMEMILIDKQDKKRVRKIKEGIHCG